MKKAIYAVVIGLVTLLLLPTMSQLVSSWLQKEEPELQHVIAESSPLEVNGLSTSIYSTSLYNVGNKVADDVRCVVTIPKAKIEKVAVNKPPSMKEPEVTTAGDTTTIHFDKLNSKDAVTVQILANGTQPLAKRPVVDARGVNVTSTERAAAQPSSQQSNWYSPLFLGLGTVIPMVIVFSALTICMTLTSHLETALKLKLAKQKIKVKLDGPDKVKVMVVEGRGSSKDWVTVLGPSGKHYPTECDFDDLRKLGEGTHDIHKRHY